METSHEFVNGGIGEEQYLETSQPYHLEKHLLGASGFTQSNTRLMGLLRGIRPGWCLKYSFKLMEWITWRPLHQLQK